MSDICDDAQLHEAAFLAASLAAAAVFWATLGAVSGWALRRLA